MCRHGERHAGAPTCCMEQSQSKRAPREPPGSSSPGVSTAAPSSPQEPFQGRARSQGHVQEVPVHTCTFT